MVYQLLLLTASVVAFLGVVHESGFADERRDAARLLCVVVLKQRRTDDLLLSPTMKRYARWEDSRHFDAREWGDSMPSYYSARSIRM